MHRSNGIIDTLAIKLPQGRLSQHSRILLIHLDYFQYIVNSFQLSDQQVNKRLTHFMMFWISDNDSRDFMLF